MSQQAINSIALYRGNAPEKIQMLLNIQKSSVVNELKEHFSVSSIQELAIRLSMA